MVAGYLPPVVQEELPASGLLVLELFSRQAFNWTDVIKFIVFHNSSIPGTSALATLATGRGKWIKPNLGLVATSATLQLICIPSNWFIDLEVVESKWWTPHAAGDIRVTKSVHLHDDRARFKSDVWKDSGFPVSPVRKEKR